MEQDACFPFPTPLSKIKDTDSVFVLYDSVLNKNEKIICGYSNCQELQVLPPIDWKPQTCLARDGYTFHVIQMLWADPGQQPSSHAVASLLAQTPSKTVERTERAKATHPLMGGNKDSLITKGK